MLALIGIGIFLIMLGFATWWSINNDRRTGRVTPFNRSL